MTKIRRLSCSVLLLSTFMCSTFVLCYLLLDNFGQSCVCSPCCMSLKIGSAEHNKNSINRAIVTVHRVERTHEAIQTSNPIFCFSIPFANVRGHAMRANISTSCHPLTLKSTAMTHPLSLRLSSRHNRHRLIKKIIKDLTWTPKVFDLQKRSCNFLCPTQIQHFFLWKLCARLSQIFPF